MLADSLLLPQCIYRPGSFTGLMLLYESNYLKLRQLTGERGALEAHWISRVRQDNDLYLEWIRIEAYTSTLRLTYWLRSGIGADSPEPDVTIRVYHDAVQAEALAGRAAVRQTARGSLTSPGSPELTLRWQRNIMLNKWLDYLLDCGHGFS
jgi:uncharacterized protein YqiB (DUF1249 family)